MYAGISAVFDIEKFAARPVSAPDYDVAATGLRVVELAHHRRQYVARLQVEIVAGAHTLVGITAI